MRSRWRTLSPISARLPRRQFFGTLLGAGLAATFGSLLGGWPFGRVPQAEAARPPRQPTCVEPIWKDVDLPEGAFSIQVQAKDTTHLAQGRLGRLDITTGPGTLRDVCRQVRQHGEGSGRIEVVRQGAPERLLPRTGVQWSWRVRPSLDRDGDSQC